MATPPPSKKAKYIPVPVGGVASPGFSFFRYVLYSWQGVTIICRDREENYNFSNEQEINHKA